MNRLRDEVGSDPISQRGIEILRSAQATSSSPELRRRVWGSLQRTPASSAVGLRLPALKALALGITGVAIAATAGAAIGGRWIHPGSDRPSTPASALPPKAQHGQGTPTRRVADAPETPEIGQSPTSVVQLELPPATARQPGARPVQPAPHKAALSLASGRTEVLDALIALRQDHDAERAGRLLDRYLAANRHGALREEALVLAIEAADVRRDQVRAQALSRAYQIEFPRGRFAPFANHHLIPSIAPSR